MLCLSIYENTVQWTLCGRQNIHLKVLFWVLLHWQNPSFYEVENYDKTINYFYVNTFHKYFFFYKLRNLESEW